LTAVEEEAGELSRASCEPTDPPAQRPVWLALIALAALASAAPIWSSELLPFQDAPQHLAAIRVLADWSSPAFAFPRWFSLDLTHSQYLGFYLPAALLAKAIGPHGACRVVLTLIAFALPASAWLLLGSFGRDRRLAIFAPALFHTSLLYIGLFNFVASIPVTVAAVALVERELRAPDRRRVLVLAAAAVALLYLHPSGFFIAAGAACFLAVTSGEPLRRKARALLPLGPALLPLCLALRAAPPQPLGTHTQSSMPRWQPFLQQVFDVGRLGNVLVGRADEIFAAAVLLAFLAIVFAPGRSAATPRAWRLPLLAACTFAVYLAAPIGAGHVWLIHLRFLPFLALVLLAAPTPAPHRFTPALLATAAVLQIGYAFVLVDAYRRFDAEAAPAPLRQVLAKAQPGRRLMARIYNQESNVINFSPYMHFGLYYQVERGGRARFNFGELPWMPIRLRPDVPAAELPPNYEWSPDLVRWDRAAADSDYLLVRDGDGVWIPEERFRLHAQAGPWSMYVPRETRRARPKRVRRRTAASGPPLKQVPRRAAWLDFASRAPVTSLRNRYVRSSTRATEMLEVPASFPRCRVRYTKWPVRMRAIDAIRQDRRTGRELTAHEPAAWSSSTLPCSPFTRTRSPVWSRRVAFPHPTTARIPSSRATMAACESGAPTSVTMAEARGNGSLRV
jgi:hypothetical protein